MHTMNVRHSAKSLNLSQNLINTSFFSRKIEADPYNFVYKYIFE